MPGELDASSGEMGGSSIAAIVLAVVLSIILVAVILMSSTRGCGSGCGSSAAMSGCGGLATSGAMFSPAAGWLREQPQRVLQIPRPSAVDSPIAGGACPALPSWATGCAGACSSAMEAARRAHDQAASRPPATTADCPNGFTSVDTEVELQERVDMDAKGNEVQRFDRLLLASVPIQGSVVRQMRTRFSGSSLVTLTADLLIPGQGIRPLYRGRAITANLRIPPMVVPEGSTLEVRGTARDSATNSAKFRLQYEACM